MTYKDVIELLESSSRNLYVPVFYVTGTMEWLPVDKTEYIRQLKFIDDTNQPYPCMFQTETDGEMFIHPNCKG